MRRSWNSPIWVGFAITLTAALSYIPIFARFPATRDVPWANLLLFLLGGWALAGGLKRAYGEPERYGGKVSGAVLGGMALALFGLFCWGNFVFARRVPSSTNAPQPGDPAPDFTLPDTGGKPVSLTELRQTSYAVLLIFYRGYWSTFCNSELRSFEKHLDEFRARGVRIAAIGVDTGAEFRKLCRDRGYTFLFLSDPQAEAIRRYGVLHPGGRDDGGDIAQPAEFLVDASGAIRWVNLTDDIRVRARPTCGTRLV